VESGLFGWSVGKVKVSAGCSVCSVSERFKKVGFGRSGAVFAWLSGLLASQIWVLPKSEFVVKCCQDSRASGSKARSLRNPKTPNKACSRLVGFVPTYKHFSGFEFFLLSKRIHARPPAANAGRWAQME